MRQACVAITNVDVFLAAGSTHCHPRPAGNSAMLVYTAALIHATVWPAFISPASLCCANHFRPVCFASAFTPFWPCLRLDGKIFRSVNHATYIVHTASKQVWHRSTSTSAAHMHVCTRSSRSAALSSIVLFLHAPVDLDQLA